MSEKRLLIITNRFPAGPDDPAAPFVYDFKRALGQGEITADIITPYYRPYRNDTRYIDSSVHPFAWSDGSRVISQLPLYDPRSFLRVRKYLQNGYAASAALLRENKYLAILALWALPSGYIARKLSHDFGVPYAVWTLGSDINDWARRPFMGRLVAGILKQAAMLYADGYELAAKTQALSGRDCRFLPSYHAVHIEETKTATPEKYFVCTGRIEKEKGVFDLLESFRLFVGSHPEWHLYYIGTGRAEAALSVKVKSYHLENCVHCSGYLERKAANRLLLHARAAIIPSHSDSLPLTFGEAMQAGRPVITSDIGDMPRFIDKYHVGHYYPVGNIESLHDRMNLIISDEKELARNCPEVIKELDIANAAREISCWLDSLQPKILQDIRQYAGA